MFAKACAELNHSWGLLSEEVVAGSCLTLEAAEFPILEVSHVHSRILQFTKRWEDD
jgi:hypothetical protein